MKTMPLQPNLTAAILVVEDDVNHMELLNLAIQELPEALPVIMAVDGLEALERLQSIPVAAFAATVLMVLLDLRLPKMHGLEVLARAHALGLTTQAPFVVLTSSDNSSERERALALGARDYQIKPVGFMPLQTMVLGLYQRFIAHDDHRRQSR